MGHKCAMPAAEVSTVYTLSKQVNRNIFSCVLKVSTETAELHYISYLEWPNVL